MLKGCQAEALGLCPGGAGEPQEGREQKTVVERREGNVDGEESGAQRYWTDRLLGLRHAGVWPGEGEVGSQFWGMTLSWVCAVLGDGQGGTPGGNSEPGAQAEAAQGRVVGMPYGWVQIFVRVIDAFCLIHHNPLPECKCAMQGPTVSAGHERVTVLP